jgi:hypothetical protein
MPDTISIEASDRELLELAAKAAGLEILCWDNERSAMKLAPAREKVASRWNPLADDGDALRLAVKLHIQPEFDENFVFTGYERKRNSDVSIREDLRSDAYAATRRAIVRAAAEIARQASDRGGERDA